MSKISVQGSTQPSADAVLTEAFASLGCDRWGGASEDGWSRISDLMRCPYRFYLKHDARMAPVNPSPTSKALDIGSYAHAGLAVHYAAMLPEGYPGWQPNVPSVEALFAACEALNAGVEAMTEARQLLDGYIEHYGIEPLVPVAVEMPCGEVGIHTSRLDLVAHVTEGLHAGLWLFDHKCLTPRSDLEVFHHDGEILGEIFSWRLSDLDSVFGEPLVGACINVLFKDRIPRFERVWLAFTPELIEEFVRHRSHWRTLEDFYRRNGYWPKSLYGCSARFGRCRFWQHCCTQDVGMLVHLD